MPQSYLNMDHIARANPKNWYKIAYEVMSECTQILCLPEKADEALPQVLKHLCTALSGRCAYLYQLNKIGWKLLQDWWQSPQDRSCSEELWPCSDKIVWQGTEPLLLEKLEPLREASPSFYKLLYAKGVTSTAVIPLVAKGKIIGCLGVENPDSNILGNAGPFLSTLSNSIIAARGWEHLQLYDGLTGIFHRGTYLKELQEIHLEQKTLGIIRFQLFDIKQMNECFGYDYGDEFLAKCIQQISKMVESCGKLYRVGYDEFAIICVGIDQDQFEGLAIELSSKLEQSVHCTVAVGYQWTAQPRDKHRLNLAAESMMEEEKRRYVRQQVLTGSKRLMEENIYEMLTIEGVTSLLAEGRFIVYLQPKLSFQDGSLIGAATLVCFLDAAGAIVEPECFLPDLESSMLTKYVDLYAFEQACRFIRSWTDKRNHEHTSISVNFSKITMIEPNIVSKMLHLCRKYEVEPGFLEVKIAGGMDKRQSKEISKVIDKIRAAGFVLSMDDFGICFANLSLLISLECNKLKVDQSLIENITASSKEQSILRALGTLGTAMGTKTTIEGIETEEQLSLLKSMGFDEMKGYLMKSPLLIDEFKKKYF